mgnify:CR=1 FL=1
MDYRELAETVGPRTGATQEWVLRVLREGIISGGMIPKMECCVQAIHGGVERVHILDGRIPHSILIEILTDEGIGTMFVSGNKLK